MSKKQMITMDALGRICQALNCDIEEVVQYIREVLEVAVSEFKESFEYNGMIYARDAQQHEAYFCPYCGVKVSRRNLSNGNVIFARFPGEPLHHNDYCKYIVKNNFTLDAFNYDVFFTSVFKETRQKQPGSGGPKGPVGVSGSGGPEGPDGATHPNGSKVDIAPIEIGGEDGGGQEDYDEQGNGERPGELPDDDDIAANTPKKKVSSLADLYKCGLHELPPDTMLGQCRLRDVLISKQRRAAKLLFEDGFAGQRVIQAWPDSSYNSQKCGLIFYCAYHDGNQWNYKRLVLKRKNSKQNIKRIGNGLKMTQEQSGARARLKRFFLRVIGSVLISRNVRAGVTKLKILLKDVKIAPGYIRLSLEV